MPNFFWSSGNEKLNKTAKAWTKRFKTKARFVGFNIPRLKSKTGRRTCPYAGACADVCYADQGRMGMPMAINSRERNLDLILSMTMPKFRDAALEDLGRMRTTTHVRIHDSGDFYSRAYYQAWIEIAEQAPDLIFYAYTKSIPFLDWDLHPNNFRIVQSLGGRRDHEIDRYRPHSRIFPTQRERKSEGYCDGNISDLPAVLGQRRIGLVYHGTRNLTEENLVQLRVA